MLYLLNKKQNYNGRELTLQEFLEDEISELEFRYQISISDLIEILKLIEDKYNPETGRIVLDERDYR